MAKTLSTPLHDPPNPLEQQRRPAGPQLPGEARGKRTNEARNDPATEPGATEGQPRHHPAQI